MSVARRASRNIAFKALGEASRFAWALLLILVARRLGGEALGRISFAYSFTYLFVLVLDLGLNVLVVREVARHKAEATRYLGALLFVKLLGAPLTFAAIAATIVASGYPAEVVTVVLLFSGISLARGVVELYGAVFSGLEVMEREAVLKGLHQGGLLTAGAIAIWMGSGPVGLVTALVIASVVTVAIGFAMARRAMPSLRARWDGALSAGMLRRAVPVGVTVMFIALYNQIDIVILSYLGSGEQQVGWYAAASRVMKVLQLVPMLVVTGVYPVFSDLARGPRGPLGTAYRGTLKLLLVLGIPLSIAVAGLAEPLIRVVFGSAFSPAVSPLRVLAWSIPFLYAGYVLVNILVSSDRTGLAALVTGGAAAINVVANLWLIPILGVAGAALAAVASQVGLVVIGAIAVERAVAGSRWLQVLSKPVAAGAAMAAAFALIGQAWWAVALPGGLGIYLLVLLMTGAHREEEFIAVRGLWRRAQPDRVPNP
jgi:O-antigen/teichoic acid export membrane protein